MSFLTDIMFAPVTLPIRATDAAGKAIWGGDSQPASPYGGIPPELQAMLDKRPQISDLLDPKTGQLADKYKLIPGNKSFIPELDKRFQDLENMPYKQSPWATMMLQKQGIDQGHALSQLGSGFADARSSLASKGGLSSGASERLALANARQSGSLAQQGAENRLGIGLQDFQTQRDLGLKNIDAFKSAATADQANTNAINTNNANLAFGNEVNSYNNMMNAWAANNTANALAPQKSGSSFICTELRSRNLMTSKESVIMTKFMLRSVIPCAKFLFWYFRKGKKAVDVANRQNFDWAAVKTLFVDDIIEAMKTSDEKAQKLYIMRTCDFARQFLGNKAGFKKYPLGKSPIYVPMLLTIPAVWKWSISRVKERSIKHIKARVA